MWLCGEVLYYEGCTNRQVKEVVDYLLGCGTKDLQEIMHELVLRRPLIALNAVEIFRHEFKAENKRVAALMRAGIAIPEVQPTLG